ncbi:MAG: serine protease, partial [Proteobacteria bacterium]|nr:serine protease [Pseudomonadota bacterium]
MILSTLGLTQGCARNENTSHRTDAGVSTDSQPTAANAENGRAFVGMSVASIDALPPCNEILFGRIVYVVSEQGFRICDATGVAAENRQWRLAAVSAEDSWQKAFKLHQKYHNGIIRIAVQCEDAAGSRTTSLGSGFHCFQGFVCTSSHVLNCPTDSTIARINLHRITGSGDSIADAATDMPPPFYSIQDNASAVAQITRHPTRDLAKLRLASDDPKVAEMPVLSWSIKPFPETIKTLSYVLSMSFPLGFTDLYTHLGAVNASSIGECNNSTNGCLRGKYDFSTTNDTDHGSSGSPLLNLDGQVIGIV